MKFHVNREHGHIQLGPLLVSWAMPDPEFSLPAFLVLGFNNASLEFGDIDQGFSGIHLVRWINDEPVTVKTFVKF